MKRFPLPAAILALALPTAGSGETIALETRDFVERVSETLREPMGPEITREAEPARVRRVEVHFGPRPRAGSATMGFKPAAGGPPDLRAGDPASERGPISALIRFDTAGTSAETVARTMVTVARGGASEVDADAGLSRVLADPCGIDRQFRELLVDGRRVELSMPAKF